ncbi:site-specific integrase [Bacteroides stercoris]|jgi:site-specific recombinase XerD|uniref:site-specific integrase n=1 Tax=Bacteroides stercoris TaxID=46506 RepID=UPI000E42E4F6|nr:site-specific integrase [Bacteroides stercoris]RGL92576.1 site-specific integrase [Bacteroides stercoris]RGT29608.1 site-specific integrase [Bacteroides stercoris]
MNATISVVCYKSKTLSNGEYPLMLRICKDGKKKYQSLGISVLPRYWDFTRNKPKPNCPNKEYIQKIILDKQTELQQRMLEFNSEQKEYTTTTLLNDENKRFELKTVCQFYQELIEQCKSNDKCGNRLIYKGSYNSLKVFTKNQLDIPFSTIDVSWLNKYEKWLRSKGNKETTMSLMFRTLRSAYNKAIKAKCARKSDYPFDEYKINKFDTKTQKRAIAKTEVLKFTKEVDNIGKRQYVQLSKDIFIFSYLCGGINFTDIANLTKTNITNGRIHYIRQKTGKLIKLGISEEAMQIIKKYESESKGYLFPILNANIHKTPLQKQNRIHKMLGKINKNLKLIAAQLNVDANMTTYVARHSFASVLKKSGVSIALISEALGHSDLSTTQVYLDSFDNEQIDAAMQNLL